MVLTASDVRSAVKKYTGLSWQVETDTDERIVLTRSSYVYEFEKRGSVWELKIFNERESCSEPMCSLSPVKEENVFDDIPKLTPSKLRRK